MSEIQEEEKKTNATNDKMLSFSAVCMQNSTIFVGSVLYFFFIRFLSFVDSVAGRLSFYSHFLPLRFAFISVLSALRASDSFPTLCLYAITAFLIWKHLELISKTLIEMRTQRDITESAQRNRRTQANSKVNANVR